MKRASPKKLVRLAKRIGSARCRAALASGVLLVGACAKPPAEATPPAGAPTALDAIERLEARIAANPRSAADRAWLAELVLRRGREQDEFGDFERAEALAREALGLAPGYRRAQSSLVAALKAQHRFAEALTLNDDLLAQDPDDVPALAARFDCLLELGRYPEAREQLAALLLRDRSAPALARRARWEELSGRPVDAIETLEEAFEAARKAGAAPLQWYPWRLGRLHFGRGDLAAAEASYRRALALAPDDPAALAGLAAVRVAQDRPDEGAALYEASIQAREAPPVIWALGELWESRGDRNRAAHWYARAEALIRAEAATSAGDAHRSEWVRFFADRGRETDRALEASRADLYERRDVYTWDRHAWALHASGRFDAAREASRQALRLGTRDAWLHYHAGRIAQARGDRAAARRHLEAALAIHPRFSPLHAARAREGLAELGRSTPAPGG